jgi:type I restriction enzyme S subunit
MSTVTLDVKKKKMLVPKLRFREFEEEWKYEAIGKYIDLISGIAFKGEDISEDSIGVPILRGINITEGYIRHNKNIDRYFLGNTDKLDKIRLKEGDLVLGMDGSKVGKNSALITKNDVDSLLIQRVARLRAKKNASLQFIYLHINSVLFHKYVDIVNTSSGIPHISSKQINDFKIHFPQFPEQQKIASFLSRVDEKIQQFIRKKKLLEQYKKGIMQQLFSGKLRFKDENGEDYPDWKEKKLGEVCDIVGGGTPDTNITEYWGGEIQWFTPTEIKSDFVSNSIRTITELGLKKSSAKKLPIGTILLTTRATIGEVSISLKECSTNQGFQSLIVRKENSNVFIFNWIKKNKHELISKANGSTFPEISKTAIEKILLNVPSLPEQQKIATFLSSIDVKIESTNQQITKAKKFKKGLLQQMFP